MQNDWLDSSPFFICNFKILGQLFCLSKLRFYLQTKILLNSSRSDVFYLFPQVLETWILAHYWLGRPGALLFSGCIYFALWLALSSALFSLLSLGWISYLSVGIAFHLFPLQFFLLCLLIDKWWRNMPVAGILAACGWRGLCSNHCKIFKLRAHESIDSDFIFSFWWGILNELWAATITIGSPLSSPKHTLLKFLLNQYYLVSMRRERLQILYIKVGIEKFLWLASGQHPIHSTLWE